MLRKMKAAGKFRRRGALWTIAELKQLGKTPDSVLARRTGRTIQEIVAERENRRIKLETGPRRWTAREIKMLGRLNDFEVARRLRRSKGSVRRQRIALRIPALHPLIGRFWTRDEDKLFGIMGMLMAFACAISSFCFPNF
jgi:hypothetical protein